MSVLEAYRKKGNLSHNGAPFLKKKADNMGRQR